MQQVDQVPIALIDGGDCHLHYHQIDRTPRQDTVHGLQLVTRVREMSADVTLIDHDDILVANAPLVVTLPIARGGREFEVVKNFTGGAVVVVSTYPDTILGSTAISIYNKGTALHFKAISGGYIII